MAPQFMAFLFEPSVRGLSLRCNLGPRRYSRPHRRRDHAPDHSHDGSTSCDPAMLAADVSGDDRVTALDALMILQAAAGAIEL